MPITSPVLTKRCTTTKPVPNRFITIPRPAVDIFKVFIPARKADSYRWINRGPFDELTYLNRVAWMLKANLFGPEKHMIDVVGKIEGNLAILEIGFNGKIVARLAKPIGRKIDTIDLRNFLNDVILKIEPDLPTEINKRYGILAGSSAERVWQTHFVLEDNLMNKDRYIIWIKKVGEKMVQDFLEKNKLYIMKKNILVVIKPLPDDASGTTFCSLSKEYPHIISLDPSTFLLPGNAESNLSHELGHAAICDISLITPGWFEEAVGESHHNGLESAFRYWKIEFMNVIYTKEDIKKVLLDRSKSYPIFSTLAQLIGRETLYDVVRELRRDASISFDRALEAVLKRRLKGGFISLEKWRDQISQKAYELIQTRYGEIRRQVFVCQNKIKHLRKKFSKLYDERNKNTSKFFSQVKTDKNTRTKIEMLWNPFLASIRECMKTVRGRPLYQHYSPIDVRLSQFYGLFALTGRRDFIDNFLSRAEKGFRTDVFNFEDVITALRVYTFAFTKLKANLTLSQRLRILKAIKRQADETLLFLRNNQIKRTFVNSLMIIRRYIMRELFYYYYNRYLSSW